MRSTPKNGCVFLCFGTFVLFQLRLWPQAAPVSSEDHCAEARKQTIEAQTGDSDCVHPPHKACLFVVATGRSGSTAVLDALNQLDNVFIRGENFGMFQQLHDASAIAAQLSDQRLSTGSAASKEKAMYYRHVVVEQKKPAWYNVFPVNVPACAFKMLFKQLYGYGDFADYIVGFKEIRYLPFFHTQLQFDNRRRSGRSYPGNAHTLAMSTYAQFAHHMDFLSNLCSRPMLVFNLRRNSTGTSRSNFYTGIAEPVGEIIAALDAFGGWVVEYSSVNPDTTFTVYFEDMFDVSKNQTLAASLVSFVGVPPQKITFARLSPK